MNEHRRRLWTDALLRMATLLAAVGLAIVLIAAARVFHHTLLVVVLAVVLAVLLNPFVARLQEQRASRSLAVALVVAVAVMAVVGLGLFLLRPLIAQLSALAQALPHYFDQAQRTVPVWQSWLADLGVHVDYSAIWSQVAGRLEQGGMTVLNGVLGVLTGIGTTAADVVLVAVLTIYLMLDGPHLARAARAWVPYAQRARYDRVASITGALLGAYVRGQILLGLILGLLAGIGTWVLGVPYAAVVGVMAGVFELVPMAGPVLGAIPAVLLALLVSWRTALYVALYFVLIQQFEGHVLAPRITGRAVGLRPSLAIVALLGGFEIAGLWGALFAVPAVGIANAVIGTLWGPGARDAGPEAAPLGAAPAPARAAAPGPQVEPARPGPDEASDA